MVNYPRFPASFMPRKPESPEKETPEVRIEKVKKDEVKKEEVKDDGPLQPFNVIIDGQDRTIFAKDQKDLQKRIAKLRST